MLLLLAHLCRTFRWLKNFLIDKNEAKATEKLVSTTKSAPLDPSPEHDRKHSPTIEEVHYYGPQLYKLWRSRDSWTTRIIENIEVINRSWTRSTISYDLDFKVVRNTYTGRQKDAEVWLPLGLSKREEWLSADVASPWANRACIVTRRENTRVATYILMGYLESRGVDISVFSQRDIDSLFCLLLSPNNTIKLQNKFVEYAPTTPGSVDVADCKSLEECFKDQSFRYQLSVFLNYYPVVISLPDKKSVSRATVALSIVQKTDFQYSKRSWSTYIGGPVIPRWEVPFSTGVDAIESHVRVTIPDNVRALRVSERIDNTHLKSPEGGLSFSWTRNVVSGRSNSGVIRSIDIYMNTRRGYFTFPALALSMFSFFLAWLMFSFPLSEFGISDTSIGVIVTLLAAFPSLAVALMLMGGEHEIVSVSLGFSRLLLAAGVFSMLVSAVLSSWSSIGGVLSSTEVLAANLGLQAIVTAFFADSAINPTVWSSSCKKPTVLCWLFDIIIATTITWFVCWSICQRYDMGTFNVYTYIRVVAFLVRLSWCLCGTGVML